MPMRSRAQAVAITLGLLLGATAVADEPPATAGAPSMSVITLGTGGGPSYRTKRSLSANAVRVGEKTYIVDTGDGLMRQLAAAGIDIASVNAVFITHHHFDHNADLGPLMVFRWLAGQHTPLPIIGPPLTREMVERQGSAWRGTELAPITIGGPAQPPIASTVSVQELPAELLEPAVVYRDGELRVKAVLNDHYHFAEGSDSAALARSYALRFELPGRAIVFTGDTGPSARVERLAEGADVLVSEVIDLDRIAEQWRARSDADPAYIQGLIEHLRQDHLTPEDVGKLASRAKVRHVVLSHIVPGWDEETDLSVYTAGVKKHFKGPVDVASDLDRY